MNTLVRSPLVVLALALAASGVPAAGADKTAAELLPPSIVAYVELPQPGALLQTILNHPLRPVLEARPEYQKAKAEPGYQQLQVGIGFVEAQLGRSWTSAIETIGAEGFYFGADAQRHAAVWLAKTNDVPAVEKMRDALYNMAVVHMATQGRSAELANVEYRGIRGHRAGPIVSGLVGPWLVVATNEQLGKQIVDNYLDGGASLAGVGEFQAARAARGGSPTAWAWANLAALRSAGVAPNLENKKTDNPVAELLAGGVLDTLAKTPYITASLEVARDGLRLAAAVPHDPAWTTSPRQYYFGPGSTGAAPAPLAPRQTMLSLVAHRDLAGMWREMTNVLEPQAAAQLAAADSGLSTVFSGRDVGREVLASFGPQFQFVLARQEFVDGEPQTPAIKLPAGALIFQLQSSAKNERMWRMMFQSLVGFANIAGSQNALPQLEMETRQHGGGRMVVASYPPESDAPVSTPGKVNYNFSPTVAFVADRVMFCSTAKLAEELIDLVNTRATQPAAPSAINANVSIDGAAIRAALVDNRAHLVAQNALQKGHSQEAAGQEIDALFELARWFKGASLQMENDKQQIKLEWSVQLSPPN